MRPEARPPVLFETMSAIDNLSSYPMVLFMDVERFQSYWSELLQFRHDSTNTTTVHDWLRLFSSLTVRKLGGYSSCYVNGTGTLPGIAPSRR